MNILFNNNNKEFWTEKELKQLTKKHKKIKFKKLTSKINMLKF